MTRRRFQATHRRVLIALAEDTALTRARWLLTDGEGRVIQQGRATADNPTPPAADRVILVVAGQTVLVRRLHLPTTRPSKARTEALRILRVEGRAAKTEGLHLVLAAPDMEGRQLAAAVTPDTLQAWRAAADRLGLTPDAILPDSLLPPPPSDEDWTALPLADRVALRGRDAAVTVEPDLADLMVEGAATTVLDDPERIQTALIDAARMTPLNLLDGLSGRDGTPRWAPRWAWGWTAPVALATALAASPLILTAAEAMRLDMTAGEVNRRSRETLRKAWPDAAPDADPVAEARRRLGPAGPSGGFTRAAAALFAAVEDLQDAQLQALLLDETGVLRATLAHADYGDVARIDTALQPFGLTAVEESVGDENGRVISDILVTPR